MIQSNSCLYTTIVRLKNRVSSAKSLLISMLLPPHPKFQTPHLSKCGFMPVVVWMSPSIHDTVKFISLYNHCEDIKQSFTWWTNILTAMTISMILPTHPKSNKPDLSKWGFMPVVVWMSPSIHDTVKFMSLHNHCEATDHSFTWYIKHSNIYDHFHASAPTPQIHEPSPIQMGFHAPVVWMSPYIHDTDKFMSLHNHCEATEHSFTWYIKHLDSYDHFHASAPTPQIPKPWPIQMWFHAWSEWSHPSMIQANSCLYTTIVRI